MAKLILILLFCVVSVKCGLLKDVLGSKSTKDESNKDDVDKKLNFRDKVVETLDNGTIIIVNALGDVIGVDLNPKDDNTKSKDVNTGHNINNTDVVKAPSNSNTGINNINGKNDTNLITTESKDNTKKLDDSKPENLNGVEDVKLNSTVSNNNNTISDIKEPENIKNKETSTDITTKKSEEIPDPKEAKAKEAKNRASLVGDDCPNGKSRADDGTCVGEEVNKK